jgi:hypothetical protein
MSESDFVNITRNGELCNSKGEIGTQEFETIMRREVMSYLQTRLTDFSNFRTGEDIEFTHLGTLKTILSEVLVLAEVQHTANKDMQDVLGQIKARLTGDNEQRNFRILPIRRDATKALRSCMDALAAELVGVRAAIQEHIDMLKRAHCPAKPAPLPAHTDTCFSIVEPAFSESLSMCCGGTLGSCNLGAGLTVPFSSESAGVPISCTCLTGYMQSTGSDALEGIVQPGKEQLAGFRDLKASGSIFIESPGTAACSSGAAVSTAGQDCNQGKLSRASGGKRRAAVDAVTTVLEMKASGSFNVEAELGASRSSVVVSPAPDVSIADSTRITSSIAPHGFIQPEPAAEQLLGCQEHKVSNSSTLDVKACGTASGSCTTAASRAKPGKAPSGKRRSAPTSSSDANAAAMTKSKTSRQDKVTRRAAGIALEGKAMSKLLAKAAEYNASSSTEMACLGSTEFAGVQLPAANSQVHPRNSDHTGQLDVAATGADEVAGPLLYPTALASLICHQLECELVLVPPSIRRHRQQWRRSNLQEDLDHP